MDWFQKNKTLAYTVGISILIIGILLFYIKWTNSIHDDEMLKHDKKILKEAKIDYQKATDSIIKSNQELKTSNEELKTILKEAENKPPIKVPVPYEKIIYIDVSDGRIIKSVTNETNRYRENKSKAMGDK